MELVYPVRSLTQYAVVLYVDVGDLQAMQACPEEHACTQVRAAIVGRWAFQTEPGASHALTCLGRSDISLWL